MPMRSKFGTVTDVRRGVFLEGLAQNPKRRGQRPRSFGTSYIMLTRYDTHSNQLLHEDQTIVHKFLHGRSRVRPWSKTFVTMLTRDVFAVADLVSEQNSHSTACLRDMQPLSSSCRCSEALFTQSLNFQFNFYGLIAQLSFFL